MTMKDCNSQHALKLECMHPSRKFVEFQKENLEKSIPDRFEKIASEHAKRTAIKSNKDVLTYESLNRKANRIAHAILASHGPTPEPVGLLFEHGCDSVAAILGVLKAGKFYVPLDPQEPASRLTFMLEDSQARLLLTHMPVSAYAAGLVENGCCVVNIDEIELEVSDQNPSMSIAPDMNAYIMYTSGSTGNPKAVVQNHRNLLQQTLIYTNTLHVSSEDRLTLLHSYNNGACTPHLFGSLLNGAALFPFNAKQNSLPQLVQYLTSEGITIYHSIPALFRSLAYSLDGVENFSKIRIVHLSGDVATNEDLKLYRDNFPSNCFFVHRLGSREANTVFLYLIDKSYEPVGNAFPVGPVVEGKRVTLIDDNGTPSLEDEVGEIIITSRYLSPGYWRDPERTKMVFKENGDDTRSFLTGDLARQRPDGNFEFLGRKDSRLKINGYRVESLEIERALLGLTVVKEAVVLGRDTSPGEKELVAYVVPRMPASLTPSDLRQLLGKTLPPYMIPAKFALLESLPVTPLGKINRRALTSFQVERTVEAAYAPPTTAIEAELARIWAEVLSVHKVGIHDDFLDLGGHSLATTRIASRVLRTFSVEIPLKVLFQARTIAQTALIIAENQVKQVDEKRLDGILAKLNALSEKDATELLAHHLAAENSKG